MCSDTETCFISQTSDGQDVKVRGLRKSLPQPVDVDTDGRFHGVGGGSPDFFQKLSPGKYLLRAGELFI